MSMIITYKLNNSLYVNMTNRCTNACSFCVRNNESGIKDGLDLWLDREPSVSEIIDDILKQDLSQYSELVFCGYGEPMLRTLDIVDICKEIKKVSNIKIRINTNGQANLIYNKDICPELKDFVDSVSISLNAKSKEEYDKICHSDFGEYAFNGLLDFAQKCKKHVPDVVLSVVDVMPKADIEACKKLANEIGVDFRIRELII